MIHNSRHGSLPTGAGNARTPSKKKKNIIETKTTVSLQRRGLNYAAIQSCGTGVGGANPRVSQAPGCLKRRRVRGESIADRPVSSRSRGCMDIDPHARMKSEKLFLPPTRIKGCNPNVQTRLGLDLATFQALSHPRPNKTRDAPERKHDRRYHHDPVETPFASRKETGIRPSRGGFRRSTTKNDSEVQRPALGPRCGSTSRCQ